MSNDFSSRDRDEADGVGPMLRASLAVPALNAEQLNRVRASVQAEWQQSFGVPQSRSRRTERLAVALLLLPLAALMVMLAVNRGGERAVAATFAVGQPGSLLATTSAEELQPLRTGAPLAAGTLIEARQDSELHWVRGGTLRLRAGSRVRILDAQHVELQSGSLYVAMTSPHPVDALSVKTAYGTVEHIGTQFLLAVSDDSLDIGVREGSVQLHGQQSAAIAAGQAVRVMKGGAVARRGLAADDAAWAWVGAPLYPFEAEGQSVLALLQWVAQEKAQPLVFDNEEARGRAQRTLLHGSIHGLSVDESLNVMLATTSLTARQGGDALHIHAEPAQPPQQ